MKLAYRLAYFSVGFLIGLIVLFFFLSGKKTSCDYGPQARTLKNIRVKDRTFTGEVLEMLQQNQLDTSAISKLLKDGKVLFSESNIRVDSCNRYVIKGRVSEKNLKIKINNCDDLATVIEARIIKN